MLDTMYDNGFILMSPSPQKFGYIHGSDHSHVAQNTALDLYFNNFASDVNCNKAIAFEIVRQITPDNSRQITFD